MGLEVKEPPPHEAAKDRFYGFYHDKRLYDVKNMDFSVNISWKQAFDKELAKELKEVADRKWELKITGRDPDEEDGSKLIDKIDLRAGLAREKMELLEQRLLTTGKKKSRQSKNPSSHYKTLDTTNQRNS